MESIIRKITEADSEHLKHIIKTVMPEFGAGGEGFAIHDKEVEDMYVAYTRPRTIYFVIEQEGKILGGGGIAPLDGGEENVCELKKMYFIPEARGKGLGKLILNKCLIAAKELGFELCYLETFHTMHNAMRLYEHIGFARINKAMGNTGHFSCDTFYIKKLI